MVDDAKRMNLSELAYVLGSSLPTVRRLIQRNPDFPIAYRGDKGVGYEFDLDAVRDWLARHEAEKAEAEAARRRQLDLYARDTYGGDAPPDDAPVMTPSERKALAEAVRMEDYNRQRREQLMEKEPTKAALRQALAAFQKDMRQIGPDFARSHGLPRDQRIALETLVRRKVNGLVDRLQKYLREDADSGVDRHAA